MAGNCICGSWNGNPITVVFLRIVDGDWESANVQQQNDLRSFFSQARRLAESRQVRSKPLHVKVVGHQTCIIVSSEALVAVRLAAEMQRVFTTIFPQHVMHPIRCHIGIHSGHTSIVAPNVQEESSMSPAGARNCDARYRPIAQVAERVASMEASSMVLMTDATANQLTDGEMFALYVTVVGDYIVRVQSIRMHHTIYCITSREEARRSTVLFSFEDVDVTSQHRCSSQTNASVLVSSVASLQEEGHHERTHSVHSSPTTNSNNPDMTRPIQMQLSRRRYS